MVTQLRIQVFICRPELEQLALAYEKCLVSQRIIDNAEM